jgi:hypothetical protein
VKTPSRCSFWAVAFPTPHMASTGMGCRNATTPSGGTSINPSGLAALDATLATNLVGPMPTEQVICCSSDTTARTYSPICAGPPNIRTAPVRSRNASSIDADSTTALTD